MLSSPYKSSNELMQKMKEARPNWYIYSPKVIEQYYFQFRDALIHTFGLLDVPVTYVNKPRDLKDLTSSDILLYVGNAATARIKEVMGPIQGKGVMTIMYETEPGGKQDRTVPISLFKPSLAWTYSKFNVHYLETTFSLPTLYVPPAYSKLVNYGLRKDVPPYPAKIQGVDRDKGFHFLSFHFFSFSFHSFSLFSFS